MPASDDLLALAAPVTPTEVYRFAAPCIGGQCPHFQHDQCKIGTRLIQILPESTGSLPPCSIRPHCRWFRQEGREVCFRCPSVVTDIYNPTAEMTRVASEP